MPRDFLFFEPRVFRKHTGRCPGTLGVKHKKAIENCLVELQLE